jgi:hypothetical protein
LLATSAVFACHLLTHSLGRGCLATASDALPSHCKCQHLTKFVFALWLGGPWTQEQLTAFHRPFLVEFMHRARATLELEHSALLTPRQWVVDNVTLSPLLLRHVTPEEAWRAWGHSLGPLVESIQSVDVIKSIRVSPRVAMASHLQFTFPSIDAVFRSLAALSGVEPVPLEGFTQDPCVMVPLLRAAAVGDNAARSALPLTQLLPLTQPELHRLTATTTIRAFRAGVLDSAKTFMIKAFTAASSAIHSAAVAPTLFLPAYVARFEQTYCADLRAHFAIQPNGLSAVACCIPTCPNYLVPLAEPPRAPGLHPRLRSHLDSCSVVPGLHKVSSLAV